MTAQPVVDLASARPARRCPCGAPLARDRAEDMCDPCTTARRDRWLSPPRVPAAFWAHPGIAQALAERHMGRVLRAYRCHPWHGTAAIPQEVVGTWLRVAQSYISRVETGRASKDLDWLAFVARTLRIPADLLWFATGRRDDEDAPADEEVAAAAAPDGSPTIHITLSPGASATLVFGGAGEVAGRGVQVVVSAAGAEDCEDGAPPKGAPVHLLAARRGRR